MSGLSKKDKLLVLERQGFKCFGRTHNGPRVITLDAYRLRDWFKILGHYPDPSVPSQAKFHHVKRRADGGSDCLLNIHALCGRCHAREHDYYRKYKK